MPVDKFSISLPEDLAAEVTRLAEERGVSRSTFIAEATSQYVTAAHAEEREAIRRANIDEAIAILDRVAAEWGPDERTVVELIAEVRGDEAAPPAREPSRD